MTGDSGESQKKFTVGQVGRAIQKMLRERAGELWVVGELIEFERNAGKFHKYATLVEKNDRGEVTASLRIILWNSVLPAIENAIQAAPRPFALQDNIEVCFKVRLEFYLPNGALSGIVTGIDPAHTLSELEKKRIEILKKLQKEGILGDNKALPLPRVITRIGLVTGHRSAGEADFIGELKKSGYAFQVFTCHAMVQGKQTAPSVVAALGILSKLPLDLICIVRGGGSRVDLAWFDDESIARAVLTLPIPLWSGIGHDIDVCVVDDVAHRHFKTPTAAAQAIVAGVDAFLSDCREAFRAIKNVWEARLGDAFRNLDGSFGGLSRGTGKITALSRQQFFNFALRYKGRWSERIGSQRLRFAEIHQGLRQLPGRLAQRRKRLMEEVQGLRQGSGKIATFALSKMDGLRKIIEISHPDRQLKRGYSITTTAEGSPLAGKPLRAGDNITTVIFRRSLKSRITEVKNDE